MFDRWPRRKRRRYLMAYATATPELLPMSTDRHGQTAGGTAERLRNETHKAPNPDDFFEWSILLG